MKFQKNVLPNAKNFSILNKLQFSYLTNLETMIKHFYIFDFWDPVTSQPKLSDLTIMSCKQYRVSCNISMNRKIQHTITLDLNICKNERRSPISLSIKITEKITKK